MFVYLDNSATTKQYDSITLSMVENMKENYGNPSSLHRLGMAAEKIVKTARGQVASALGADTSEIVFTGSGTESDNLAVLGIVESKKRYGNKIITTSVEHPAILETCRRVGKASGHIECLSVDAKGLINLDKLEAALDDKTILVSIMHVNNEVGTIQPIQKVSSLINRYNNQENGPDGVNGTVNNRDIVFHVDAIQSFGKLPINASSGNFGDLISISAHKIHGPKGIGALYMRKKLNIAPLITGGGQEGNVRSGTENVPAISGFGLAAEIATKGLVGRIREMSKCRHYLLDGIRAEIKDIRINSPEDDSLTGEAGYCCPSVLNISFLGTRSEVLLHSLEQQDIYVSTGSACASNKKGQSHVLKAMGLSDKEIEGAIRFSFSEFNTIEEMDYVLLKLKEIIVKFRRLGSFR